jgi:hypothetical protein
VNCVRHISRMFSQSIATSQQSRNGQIVSTWPNRLHTSHSACGQCFSEWPISSHVLHWWYGQSDALLVLCLLELQAEHSLSGQLASVCPCCSHKLQSSASGQFCSECPISSHVLHWWYGQSDDLLVLCTITTTKAGIARGTYPVGAGTIRARFAFSTVPCIFAYRAIIRTIFVPGYVTFGATVIANHHGVDARQRTVQALSCQIYSQFSQTITAWTRDTER